MLFPTKTKNRFQLSYKEGEVDRYNKMESEIAEKMGICTRSDVIKYSIRNTYEAMNKPELARV
tara:strand:- start:196 stop:384 length:189 start_codon:yes stop_codon:yes gene_type:complete